MKREFIESLSELCRKWLKLDNSTRNNQISVSSEWEFEELDEKYHKKKQRKIEKLIEQLINAIKTDSTSEK